MNLFLFEERDLQSPNTVRVTGSKARKLVESGWAAVGKQLIVGQREGMIGRGEVVSLEKAGEELEISLSLHLFEESPPLIPLSMVISLPRPQAVKRIIQFAATVGLTAVYFFLSERSQRSYAQSSVLRAEQIEHFLTLGLEQGRATRGPIIGVLRKRQDLEEVLQVPALKNEGSAAEEVKFRDLRYLADADAPRELSALINSKQLFQDDGSSGAKEYTPGECKAPWLRPAVKLGSVMLAVGPELGWSDRDKEFFARMGFISCTLGTRILRVDDAISVATGIVMSRYNLG